MPWNVGIRRKAMKQMRKLPADTYGALLLLLRDLELYGPTASGSWKHLSKLKGWRRVTYHCHLTGGRPTYVCCWEVVNKKIQLMEISYVGTHEKAPYG